MVGPYAPELTLIIHGRRSAPIRKERLALRPVNSLAQSLLPPLHSLNPYGLICGFGEGFAKLPGAERYGLTGQVPIFGAEVELQAGMTFSFEPSCLFGKRFVNLGGTVVVGKDKPIELNRIATRLMRV
jgi:hypothetical protein